MAFTGETLRGAHAGRPTGTRAVLAKVERFLAICSHKVSVAGASERVDEVNASSVVLARRAETLVDVDFAMSASESLATIALVVDRGRKDHIRRGRREVDALGSSQAVARAG